MAKTNYEKKFYQKIFNAIDREDDKAFYKEFTNAIKSGRMTVSQKRTKTELSFDDTWINVITRYLRNVENIVRNPRLYMMAEENVMPIQSAKKINARSVQHLSSHVQNVQEIRKDGTIVPSKILSTTYEDTLNIYENRFVMTLISKLAAFVEVRFTQAMEAAESHQVDKLVVTDKFKWRNYDVEANIDLQVKEQIEDAVSKHNVDQLENIKTMRRYVRGFMGSAFYQTMKASGARPVTPPILRTNIITKSVDYNSCLKLWQFIDSYRQLGVSVGAMDKELEFDPEFIEQISDMIMVNYSLITTNQDDRSDTYELLPYKMRPEKEPKDNSQELLVVSEEIDTEDGKVQRIEEPTVSEYFYNRMKTDYKKEFTKKINSGISYNASFINVYRKMLKIENGVQTEIIKGMEKQLKKQYPERVKKAPKTAYLKKVRSIYKSVLMVKQQDMEKWQRKLDELEEELKKR